MGFVETAKKYGSALLSLLEGSAIESAWSGTKELLRKPEPKQLWLSVTLRIADDFSSERYAREFLSPLITRGGVFLPKWWEQEDRPHQVKFDPNDLSGPLKVWKSKSLMLAGELSMTYGPGPWDENQWVHVRTLGSDKQDSPAHVSFTTKPEWFTANGGDPGQLYDLAVEWYNLFRPVYGKIDVDQIPPVIWEPPITSSIPNVYWANFFGKPYVEMIGGDKLRAAPCHRIEEMSDGGIMLMLTETPEESISKEGRAKAKEVKEHLGTEYFFDPKTERYPRQLKERPIPQFDFSRLPKRIPFKIQDIFDGYPPQKIVQNVPDLIADLAKRLEHRGIALDYSKQSWKQIDSWLEDTHQETTSLSNWVSFAESPELWRELTAYLGETVRLRTNAEWTVEKGSWRQEPIVRFGKGSRKRFRPILIVQEVMIEGIAEAAEIPEGIEATGFSVNLWTWMLTHMTKEAIKDLLEG